MSNTTKGTANQIYGHPAQNGKSGFWDRLDLGIPQPTDLMKRDIIQFTGLDLKNQHVVGVIPKDGGPNGETTFFKKTILELPPIVRLAQNTVRVVMREKDGAPQDFIVIMLFEDGRVNEDGEDIGRPVLTSYSAEGWRLG
jgi:hypothetical protein